MPIVVAVLMFVLVLLAAGMWRARHKAHPDSADQILTKLFGCAPRNGATVKLMLKDDTSSRIYVFVEDPRRSGDKLVVQAHCRKHDVSRKWLVHLAHKENSVWIPDLQQLEPHKDRIHTSNI